MAGLASRAAAIIHYPASQNAPDDVGCAELAKRIMSRSMRFASSAHPTQMIDLG